MEVLSDMAIVAVIGQQMKSTVGVAGEFGSLYMILHTHFSKHKYSLSSHRRE